jgi:hypothetical protein
MRTQVGHGVRIVIVEDASRFARELVTQEWHHSPHQARRAVLTANGDDLTDSSDPFAGTTQNVCYL